MANNNEEIARLVAAITGTKNSLEDTELIYRRLETAIRRMRASLTLGFVGLVLDLVLSLSFGLVLYGQADLNDRITANQNTIHEAECSINTLYIAVDTPEQRAKTPDRALYDKFFDNIYDTRQHLGCLPSMPRPVRDKP